MKKNILIVVLVFAMNIVFAQNSLTPVGEWRAHLSNYNSKLIAIAGSKIYCVTEGGFFVYDQDDNSIESLSKTTGLSDAGINTIKYHSGKNILVIGYENGNLDFIENGIVFNDPSIKLYDILGQKRINEIDFIGNQMLLSCEFGAVLYDLNKKEVKDSYINIGNNGSLLTIFDAAFIKTAGVDSLFLATNKGLLAAQFGTRNLLDFNNWKTIKIKTNNDSILNTPIRKLESFDNKLFLWADQKGLFQRNGSKLWKKKYSSKGTIYTLTSFNSKINICFSDSTLSGTIGSDSLIQFTNQYFGAPRQVLSGSDNMTWVADSYLGLIQVFPNGTIQKYAPNGPFSNAIFKFYNFQDKMIGLSGGFDNVTSTQRGISKGFYLYENNEWKNYSSELSNIRDINNNWLYASDISDASYNPVNDVFYFACHGRGVMRWFRDQNYFDFINDITPKSTLINSLGAGSPYCRVPSLYTDDKTGDVWLVNHIALPMKNRNSVHQISLNSRIDFSMKGIRFLNNAQLNSEFGAVGIIPDDVGNKWVRFTPGYSNGLFVFKDSTKSRLLRVGKGKGNLPSDLVTCFVKDLEGQIWIGTSSGVASIYNPNSALNNVNSTSGDFSTPIIAGRPLLYEQYVNCIDVDGANRKWVGTLSGLYLFSADGTEQVNYFNTSNSPLLSDNILDVKVNQASGEVFIATDKGIISYRGNSTKGLEEKPSKIRIFPNPLRPDFNGIVGINGLGTNSLIKIVDLGSRLIYQTTAKGGMATWNGVDGTTGTRANAGVYMILASTDTGDFGVVGKIIVLD